VTHRHAGYIPAAGHDFFLPLYDPVLRYLMRERALRTRFLDLAAIQPGQRVLDLGCGTATLLLLLKERCPSADVVGVDGDPKVLALARAKAEKQGVAIRFDEALATRLPYGDASFDRVLSSLVLHHLTRDEKLQALREVRRVLAPGASFHLADFGPPRNWLARGVLRALNHGEQMADNLAGRLPELLREAGFTRVEERGYHTTVFGTLVFVSGWNA
jgi:ubiquinone/menaquinone biosynthesis C-methylase UbiE